MIRSLNSRIHSKHKKAEEVIDTSLQTARGAPSVSSPGTSSVETLDFAGMTPLHWACRKNSIEEVKKLIDKGANINTLDKDGISPLKWCIALRYYDLALLLLEIGCEMAPDLQIADCLSHRKQFLKHSREQFDLAITAAVNEEKFQAQFYFPKSFALLESFKNLKSLILSFNDLKTIPEPVLAIHTLTELDVSHNSLEDLPEAWKAMPRLEIFNVSHNFLRKFGKGAEHLTTLNISHNLIDELLPEISRFYRLSHLNCSHNYLTSITRHIVEISTLEHLDFSHNYITALRDIPIHILQFLVHLDLSYNSLEMVPYEDILASRTIRSFGFTHNKFPLEYFRIMKSYYSLLDSLDLSNLGLSTLPDQLRLLTHLRELNLRNNQFTTLPAVIGNLVELTSLDLSYNRLADLPLFIRKLTRLQYLNLEETKSSIVNPPRGVVERGLKSIMGHYEDLLQGEPCFRLKIMFVGQENVGKSTLLHALVTHKGKKKGKRGNISTDGIDIERWQLKTPTKQTLTFSAWDFAGQEIYYATHSLFLSTKAIYLIVWDLRYSDNNARVEFWLNSVASRARDAPVILVGSHVDDEKFQEKPELIQKILVKMNNKYSKRFKNIKRILAVSASTGEGVPEVMDNLRDIALSMSNIKIPMPKIYQSLEDLLFDKKESLSPPALDWNSFVQLASEVNFKDEDQLLRATNFLNDLGSLVFFEDDKTLERLVVLDPQWLTSMFASVITTSHTYVKNGILRTSLLGQIWRSPQYPANMHGSLLGILQKFEILYPLPPDPEGDQCYLIPSLLPEEMPAIDLLWPVVDSSVTQFFRQYTLEFIPNGLFSKFMVRFLHFTDMPLKYWQAGVLADRKGDRALVELREETIYISVRGNTAGEFLRIIIEIVDVLVNSFFKVEVVSACVPCPHCLALGKDSPFLFDVLDCELAASRMGARVIRCPYAGGSNVRLDCMVPDIAMTDFQGSQIDFAEVQLQQKIGRGAFGEIFRGTWKNEEIAIKRMKGDQEVSITAFGEFRREVWLMSGLQHPCIVNLKGFSLNPLAMLLECVTGGDLFKLIHNPEINLDWHLRLKIATDMACGIGFLHSVIPPLLHRDLKSPNILVMKPHDGAFVIAKIADFGLSSKLFTDSLLDRAVENPTWCAPEVLMETGYTQKADVYSFGIILWELLTRLLPYDNYKFQHQVEKDVIKGIRPSIPDDCWEEYKDLISACWHADPAQRPLFPEIIERLYQMIEKNIGFDKFRYGLDPSLRIGSSNVEETDSRPASTQNLAGTLTRKIAYAGGSGGIKQLLRVGNQVWCTSFDGVLSIFSAESGIMLTSFTPFPLAKVSCMAEVGDKVWTASNSNVTAWLVEDLVGEQVKEIKIRAGVMFSKQQDKKSRFSSKKRAPRYCVLTKSGQLKLYRAQNEPKPFDVIYLKDARLEVDKNQVLSIIEANGRVSGFQIKSEEMDDWLTDLRRVIARCGDVPLTPDVTRKISSDGFIQSICVMSPNNILLGGDGIIQSVDSKLRVKHHLYIPLDIADHSSSMVVNCLVDSGYHCWAAVHTLIIILFSTSCKIKHILYEQHTEPIQAMLKVGDEIWSASEDSIVSWNAKTGQFVSVISNKPGWRSLAEVGDSVWAGTASGAIVVFDIQHKVEKTVLKQHKAPIVCQECVVGGAVWSGAQDHEICVWI